MRNSKLQLSKTIDYKSLLTFCGEVWISKPWSHNRQINFYRYIEKQPTLKENEKPVIRIVRGETTEAILGLLKFKYKGFSVYSGFNLYTLPELENKGVHGILLVNYWKKHCDIMYSSSPRSRSREMYEKAKWTKVDTYRLKCLLQWKAIPLIWRENRKLSDVFVAIKYYLRFKFSTSKFKDITLEKLNYFDDEINEFLKELSIKYHYFDRDFQLLNWRYFSFSSPGVSYDAFVMRHHRENRILGYFVLSIQESNIKVCEIFAFPENWAKLVQSLRQTLSSYKKKYAVLETNLLLLVDLAICNQFYVTNKEPNYFKVQKQHSNLLKEFISQDYILSPSDSDEYLL